MGMMMGSTDSSVWSYDPYVPSVVTYYGNLVVQQTITEREAPEEVGMFLFEVFAIVVSTKKIIVTGDLHIAESEEKAKMATVLRDPCLFTNLDDIKFIVKNLGKVCEKGT